MSYLENTVKGTNGLYQENTVKGTNGLYQEKNVNDNMTWYGKFDPSQIGTNYVVSDPKNQKFGIICNSQTGEPLGKIKLY